LKADVAEIGEVDRVCGEIRRKEEKDGKQGRINLLVMSQGNLNLKGWDENSSGLDRKSTLNYYSRMRFIHNLMPLLRPTTSDSSSLSRVLSILGAGHEGYLNLDDIPLKKGFSTKKCADHTTMMNTLMVEQWAKREQRVGFAHSSPGVVNTGIGRELPLWGRIGLKVLIPLMSPWMTGLEETGERQLWIATNKTFTAKDEQGKREGESKGAMGVDGEFGSGGYAVNWDGEITNNKLVEELRKQGVGSKIWEHTQDVWREIENGGKRLGGTGMEA